MRSFLILPAILGLALFAAPAMANQPDHANHTSVTPAQRCDRLENRFDKALKTHDAAAQASEAEHLRGKAGMLCSGGDYSAGIIDLKVALEDLNVYLTH